MSLKTLITALALAVAPVFGLATDAKPVLTINGAVDKSLTREELAALPQHTITQTTEYTEGETTFVGPLARDVLSPPAGATLVVMTAANDYSVEIPVGDLDAYDVILALEMNGKALTSRDKGPVWVMYRLALTDPAQRSVFDNRLIWQVRTVSFR